MPETPTATLPETPTATATGAVTATYTPQPTVTPSWTPTPLGTPYLTPTSLAGLLGESSMSMALSAQSVEVGQSTSALIAAIQASNPTFPNPCPQPTTLNLSTGYSYVLTAPAEGYFGSTGLPVIRCDVTINGNNATIARDPNLNDLLPFRIIAIAPNARLTLNSVTIRGGFLTQTGGAGIFNNAGTLIINNSTITANRVQTSSALAVIGAGIYNNNGSNGPNMPLEITGSIISGNSNITTDPLGVADGGGIGTNGFGTITIRNSTITGNFAERGGGIGLHPGSVFMTLEGNTIENNRADNAGGGIFSDGNYINIVRNNIRNNESQTSQTSFAGGGAFIFNGFASYNCVTGNDNVSFSSAQVVNAPESWWGAGNGPGGAGPGSGDTISASINLYVPLVPPHQYRPFIVTPQADCKNYTPPPPPATPTPAATLPPTLTPTPSLEQAYYERFVGMMFWIMYNETSQNQMRDEFDIVEAAANSGNPSDPNRVVLVPPMSVSRSNRSLHYLFSRAILGNIPTYSPGNEAAGFTGGYSYGQKWGGSINDPNNKDRLWENYRGCPDTHGHYTRACLQSGTMER